LWKEEELGRVQGFLAESLTVLLKTGEDVVQGLKPLEEEREEILIEFYRSA